MLKDYWKVSIMTGTVVGIGTLSILALDIAFQPEPTGPNLALALAVSAAAAFGTTIVSFTEFFIVTAFARFRSRFANAR